MIEQRQFAGKAVRHVFLHDMVLPASIGVYAHEKGKPQRIRINVDLVVEEQAAAGVSRGSVGRDDLSRVLNYETVVDTIRAVVTAGHVQLVETLAERIAESCLLDRRVELVRVRVEKLDVFSDVGSVGVEIERDRTTCPRGAIDSQ